MERGKTAGEIKIGKQEGERRDGRDRKRYLVSSGEMKRYDRNTIEYFGVPSAVLMERAALAVAEEIKRRCPKGKRVLVAAGCGNNGGDGIAAGRLLMQEGYAADVWLVGERGACGKETVRQLEIIEKYGCPVQSKIGDGEYDIIVDALFGIGLSRNLEGIYAQAVEEINRRKAFVCAVDIPSGIHTDTGAVMGTAVKADLTVTFAFEKPGHVLYPGCRYAGEVVCRQIGITQESFLGEEPKLYTGQGAASRWLPDREAWGNKGTFGKVLVIAGSLNMSGACELCAKSAYRTGAGMVKVVTPEENRLIIQQKVPEALLLTYRTQKDGTETESREAFEQEMEEQIERAFDWADVIVIGPGTGTGREAERLLGWSLTKTRKPLVIDADGINLLAGRKPLLKYLEEHAGDGREIVMTPHAGEFARLCGRTVEEVKEGILYLAKELAARYGCVMAAKDARTVVASCRREEQYLNTTGNDGMATAGMGDVLTGIIGGLMAQGMTAEEAAEAGVYLHGMAGDLAAEETGRHGLMAGDVVRKLAKLQNPAVLPEAGTERKTGMQTEIRTKTKIQTETEEIPEKYSRIYASVDLDAIRLNMENMKKNIAPETKIMAVIKADGYGHGAAPVAKELEPLDYLAGFAVATAEEAVILRKCGIRKPLLVLGYTFPCFYEEMIDYEIRPAVFRPDMIEQLSACAEKRGRKAKVHIKVDTGMSRIGIRPDEEGMELVKKVLGTPGLELEGIFTHFARADERDKSAAEEQLSRFWRFTDRIEAETGYHIPVRHCSNSAGIVEMRKANMDMVRAGIILYGLWPSEEVSRDIVSLRPVMEVKSRIVYIKEIEAGTPVSYGGTFTARRKTRIATIPAGYGDGYPRGLSGKGSVLVRGKRAPILGRVCMDQFMADVTDIPDAAEGDTVTLIGRDGDGRITMEELGEQSGRFNYELACCMGKRVPRIYLKSGKIVGTKDYFHDFE